MKHIPVHFIDHEIAMEVWNWPDLNLMGHENMCSSPWNVRNMNPYVIKGHSKSENNDLSHNFPSCSLSLTDNTTLKVLKITENITLCKKGQSKIFSRCQNMEIL